MSFCFIYMKLEDEAHSTTEHTFTQRPHGFVPQCCLSVSLQCHDPFNLDTLSESPLSAIHHTEWNNNLSGFLFTA